MLRLENHQLIIGTQKLRLLIRLPAFFRDPDMQVYMEHADPYYRARVIVVRDWWALPLSSFLRRVWKRAHHFRKVRVLRRRIKELHEHLALIVEDPLCGCPEDFCWDYSRKIGRLEAELQQYEI